MQNVLQNDLLCETTGQMKMGAIINIAKQCLLMYI